MAVDNTTRTRCVALVGPYLSGKTTLMEGLLHAAEAIHRRGSVRDGNTVGDGAPEARARGMSVEVSVAEATHLGDRWTFLDCPGSLEFAQDARDALMVADSAVVVCEPDPAKVRAVGPLLHYLDALRVPHAVFVNKVDQMTCRARDMLAALQEVSSRPMVLRQIPIREGESVTGYVDLVSERAYRYEEGKESALIPLPDALQGREQEARQEMLEQLADHDDALLEQLLEDTVPERGEIYGQLAKDLRQDLIVPVLLGSAEHENGLRRLLKLLRHEAPHAEVTADRVGLDLAAARGEGTCVLQVFKTAHLPHVGKISLARIWAGEAEEGMHVDGHRIGGLYRPRGHHMDKLDRAGPGAVVGLGKVEGARTGDVLSPANGKLVDDLMAGRDWPAPLGPVYGLAIEATRREDEVKLTGAIHKLREEDPSLVLEHPSEAGEMVLRGQGEIHLQVTLDRLRNRNGIEVRAHPPQTAYRETIRKPASHHARYKRQTGGHGQFGDVKVEIAPRGRGEGFAFGDKVVGGAVPKQFIPAVEHGVREALGRGPLGFPVVDLAVTLVDGQHHSVDSSEQSFKIAGRMAMTEALPGCDPVLLEPILKVTVAVPNDHTSKAQRIISGRRGQILGFDAKVGWEGWDEVQAFMPESEVHDLIVELRSLTAGMATYEAVFDHLQELTGRNADAVVKRRAETQDAARAQ